MNLFPLQILYKPTRISEADHWRDINNYCLTEFLGGRVREQPQNVEYRVDFAHVEEH